MPIHRVASWSEVFLKVSKVHLQVVSWIFICEWSLGSFLVVQAKKDAYNMFSGRWADVLSMLTFYLVEEGKWLAEDQPLIVCCIYKYSFEVSFPLFLLENVQAV